MRMKAALVCSAVLAGSAQAGPPMDAPRTGKITFEDDFTSLDSGKFTTRYKCEIGCWRRDVRWMAGNKEQQIYVERSYTGTADHPLGLNPFSITNEGLQIQADVAAPRVAQYLHGQKYTSGVLTTYDSFSQRYGYFEARMKMPVGRGYWPAFWMLPRGEKLPDGPPEIDVVEVLGHEITTLHVTAHWNAGKQEAQKSFAVTVPDMSAAFHTYGMLWTAECIAWYFDGKRIAYMATPATLHSPMYLIVNLAVGGKWGGYPDEKTRFPGTLSVDYIRVYTADGTRCN
jgi:beta-glucanase (GH16 family)